MNVRQISVEFGATIPTASFANVKIGATWIVDLAEDESPELATAELYRRIREILQAAYAANAPESIEDSQPSLPPAASQPPQNNAPATPKNDEAGGVYRGTGIARVGAADGSSQFEIYYLFGNTGQDSKYPLNIKGRDFDRLCVVLEAKGFSPMDWPLKQRFALAINIPWTQGNPNPNRAGTFYKHYGAFDVLGEKTKA